MSKRRIKKVAVIGSGIMGSGIACHFANIGVKVVLLDIVPFELKDKEKEQGLTLQDKVVRNRLVNDSLVNSIKSRPAPLYHKDFASRITTGNLDDDISKVKDVDWIIEVVVERLDIKKQVFDKLEEHRSPGTLITSNTSGIPIKYMNEGRSEDFQKHFCGTHFFNPPRYLKLFEIIPGPNTSHDVLDFLNNYGDQYLGKTAIIAKDTPAFIGNRIGIFGIQSLFHLVKEMGLTVEEVDKLTGPVIGRPKSATFRTVDVVGLDTLVHVANGLYENCQDDEEHEIFKLPDFINKMMENNWLGSKSGQGFYKKVKGSDGKSEILAMNLTSLEYAKSKKASFATLELTKSIDNVIDRYKVLVNGKDKAGEFYKKNFAAMFAYSSKRIPEITDELFKIDAAMKAGFGWEHGPFEIWDAIGVKEGLKLINDLGKEPDPWVTEMIDSGIDSFYTIKDGASYFYDIPQKKHIKVPGQDAFIILNNIRESNEIFKNSGVVVEDLGDGIINVDFQSKMNSIGGDVLSGLNKAIDLAEKDFDGMVIGNQGANGVGVIPGGGGSKEMALRASDIYHKNDVELNVLQEYFLTIGMAKVSTSAYEAYDTGILKSGKDIVIVNKDRQIAAAKAVARLMADQGYTMPIRRNDIKVLGKQALGMFLVGTDSMQAAKFISEHDKKIANKLAYVMAGGDLSESSYVSEQYLLDIEREAFLSLCTERKTLERLEYMIKKGKPLRN